MSDNNVPEEDFLSAVSELLNVEDDVTMDTELDGLEEWDSLSALMFQSYVFKRTNKAPKPTDLKAAKTVRDLYEFVKQ